jgi:hypothetical protein
MARVAAAAIACAVAAAPLVARAATPVAGHYPPGQSGLRGAGAAPPGFAITNFNRAFSNLEATDAQGNASGGVGELRYANITMLTWATNARVFGMRYGALAGIPFATGNLNPSSDETASSAFGLGDVLVTPLSLYGSSASWDTQLQFTVWSASGNFEPSGTKNRGAGFWALVYSAGGVWYPRGGRDDWSASAIARFEQNFEQRDTGIQPGNDLVVDWGVGKVVRRQRARVEAGVSGFATWQTNRQSGTPGGVDPSPYRYFGAGPEASLRPWERWTFRVRAQWEFGVRNAVQGNNLWCIVHFAS